MDVCWKSCSGFWICMWKSSFLNQVPKLNMWEYSKWSCHIRVLMCGVCSHSVRSIILPKSSEWKEWELKERLIQYISQRRAWRERHYLLNLCFIFVGSKLWCSVMINLCWVKGVKLTTFHWWLSVHVSLEEY